MSESSFQGFLYDLNHDPVIAGLRHASPVIDMIRRDFEERKRQDDAYLAALTPHARKVELTKRRIARCEQRFRTALDFTRYEDD